MTETPELSYNAKYYNAKIKIIPNSTRRNEKGFVSIYTIDIIMMKN